MHMPKQSAPPKLYLQDGASYWIAMAFGRVYMCARWNQAAMAFGINAGPKKMQFSVDEVEAVAPKPTHHQCTDSKKERQRASRWTPIEQCFLSTAQHNPALSQSRRAILTRKLRAKNRQQRERTAKGAVRCQEPSTPSTWVHPYRRLPSTTGSQ